jgi:hypothetical protein
LAAERNPVRASVEGLFTIRGERLGERASCLDGFHDRKLDI